MAYLTTTMVYGWNNVVNNVQPCRCSTNGMQRRHKVVMLSGEIMSSKTNLRVEKLSIHNVLKFMRANDMFYIYPNMSILYHIYLTLPISCAGAERSFSRLKFMKSYLRSTMTEEGLSGLSLLSIKRQFATELDYDKVMDYFAKMKPRRNKLFQNCTSTT